jgi:copper transport protein
VTSQRTGRRGRGRDRPPGLVARALLCLLIVGALSGLTAPAAHGHASLVSTDPSEGAVLPGAPETLTLTFDEPVSLVPSATRLFDADGEEVPTESRSVDETVTVLPTEGLEDGTFVLTYRVISADSHPVAGSLSFSVGSPSASVAPPETETPTSRDGTVTHSLVQGLTYVSLLLAGGLAAFLAVLLPGDRVLDRARTRLLRVLRLAAGATVVGAVLLVVTGVAYRQGLGLAGILTTEAWSGFVSADGLLAAVAAAGLGLTAAVLRPVGPTRTERLLALGGAGVALAAPALVGHTRAFGPAPLVLAADVLHLLAGAVWFGGLVGLALTLPTLATRERLAARTLARFSSLAGGLLALVAVAGLLLGWRILGSWSALVGTTYGAVLIAKTVLVALVVTVAAWNRWRLLPAVVEPSGHQPRVNAAVRLRTAIRFEVAGLVAVVLVTGFLVNQPPGEDPGAAAAPTERSTVIAVADDVRVVAHLAPGAVGPNTVTVQVQGPEGEPLEPFAAPVVSVGSEEVDLGSRPVRNIDSGTYASQVMIPGRGRWTVRVSVRTDEFTNPVLTLEVDVGS